MPCYSPLEGYRSREVGPSGKRRIVFNPRDGYSDLPVTVPCGQCTGCRLEKSRQWAMRCMHEASLYDDNCFITLTYSNDHLPEFGSLEKRHFQLFMKRLRKKFNGTTIRFYHCGEYGDQTGRPHYHALLFGFDFPDKVYWTVRNGLPVYRSAILEKLWPMGQSEIGSVTFESAAYVARYCMKKVTGDPQAIEDRYGFVDEDGVCRQLQPEYATMSRGKGIGKGWFEKFKCDVYPSDGVVVRGMLMKPPKYYDGQFEKLDAEVMDNVRRKRRLARNPENETPERMEVREKVAKARLQLKARSNI